VQTCFLPQLQATNFNWWLTGYTPSHFLAFSKEQATDFNKWSLASPSLRCSFPASAPCICFFSFLHAVLHILPVRIPAHMELCLHPSSPCANMCFNRYLTQQFTQTQSVVHNRRVPTEREMKAARRKEKVILERYRQGWASYDIARNLHVPVAAVESVLR